ncbi:MAG: ABC transporter ATP-binding protein, partial [Bacteroidaceae bacterium]|nr:ABC transporter ATP-binding protein [Bacteroidaceae bacterium]
VISTHQVRDIDSLLDHVIIIDNNRILLDRSVSEICSRLRFTESPTGQIAGNELYVQPSIQGNSVILPNTETEEESLLNLELLFNGILAEREKIQAVFND